MGKALLDRELGVGQLAAVVEVRQDLQLLGASWWRQQVLRRSFVDLGRSPLSNGFLTAEQLRSMEPHYPLHAYVCENCLLVQLEAVVLGSPIVAVLELAEPATVGAA